MRQKQTPLVAGQLVLAVVLFTSNHADAAGFGLREGSADWLANAFAGDTAKAYDAATAFSNPAGLVRLDANEIDGSVNVLLPNFSFSGANLGALGPVTPGTTGGNLAQAGVTPGVFGVWNVAPDFKLGLAFTSPFGERVANPGDFVGRFQSLVSSISDFNTTLAAAYRVNEHLSIGGGPVIDYFSARLTQALNIGVNQLTGDPVADVHGGNVSVGLDVGVLYQFDEQARIGINYRSQVHHNISLDQSVFVPPLLAVASPATAGLLAFGNTRATTSITLPDSVTVGFYYQLTTQWAVMADAGWTHWSLIKGLTITPANGTPPTVIPENLRDTGFVSVGANYQPTERLMLQAGFAFDESPVTAENRTTRLPDSNRFILGLGATWSVTESIKLQTAYGHVFLPAGSIRSAASTTSGLIVGTYSDAANVFSVGAVIRF
ncbi:MAG TPA: outer membrane protein transport protein [Acetobacteraceae bacterium]|nr:outer membrane protein transport protein [Acetobacteraceae bacterium]